MRSHPFVVHNNMPWFWQFDRRTDHATIYSIAYICTCTRTWSPSVFAHPNMQYCQWSGGNAHRRNIISAVDRVPWPIPITCWVSIVSKSDCWCPKNAQKQFNCARRMNGQITRIAWLIFQTHGKFVTYLINLSAVTEYRQHFKRVI